MTATLPTSPCLPTARRQTIVILVAAVDLVCRHVKFFAPRPMKVPLGIACVGWCLSQPIFAALPADYVQSIDWSRYNGMLGVQPNDAFGQSLIGVLQNESRYELNWAPSYYEVGDHAPLYVGIPYYWAFTHNTSGGTADIRPLASFAYGTAALLATGTYSPTAAGGISEPAALYETELAIRGVAFAHVSNTTDSRHFGGGGYGSYSASNQAAYWTAQAAEAAWMLWDKLSTETRTAVATMVEYEANSFNNYTVPYWKQPNGTTNFSGDTKAEETAWNVQLLALAQTMMPSHPNVNTWRTKASEMQVSTLSRRTDNVSSQLIDGRPVQDWINGYNSYADGVLVNHSIVHPDYMTASIYLLTTTAVNQSLAGRYIPQSTVFNVDNVYRGLTEVQFTPGPDKPISQGGYGTNKTILEPGGTIFNRNPDGSYSANVYYPEGNDWNIYVVTDSYLNTDLVAEWLGLDEGKSFDAMGWAQARVDAMIALQNRPGHDGNIYEPADWGGNGQGADEDFYHSNAVAWLQWWLLQHNQFSPISEQWGQLPAGVSGDYNGNGTVDAADYVIWRKNNGLAGGASVEEGDGTGDGLVTTADFDYWRARFGNSSSNGTGAQFGFAVPEPMFLVLVASAATSVMLVSARYFSRN
ncbi:MAG: hypothetical protein IT425_05460 [Pirellulales bacterium]|nr:hypothetical protein [Pirellulales bacterium]